ncbi:MAG: GMC family oxidoreductase, partial [Myxococcales bacterium]|nr:GMC family oxidoreductase [Myxococcales bacterium]
PLHPMLAATALGGSGRAHQEIMSQLPHIAVGLGILLDGLLPEEQGGTVTLRSDGRPRIEYPLEARHWEAFRASSRILSRIHLAAGARKVLSMHDEPVSIESEADLPKLDAAPWQKLRIPIFTAHQMGGCPMGADPERSVVDRELRLRGVDNLFVCDGSVFPTALGVNPSETIYGLAHWAAGPISGAI